MNHLTKREEAITTLVCCSRCSIRPTPGTDARNSVRFRYEGGIVIGLRTSSGASSGMGKAARSLFRAWIMSSASSEGTAVLMTWKLVSLS